MISFADQRKNSIQKHNLYINLFISLYKTASFLKHSKHRVQQSNALQQSYLKRSLASYPSQFKKKYFHTRDYSYYVKHIKIQTD